MKKTQESSQQSTLWRWVLMGIAVTLTMGWLFLTPRGLLGKAAAVGYSVCHQIPEHSFPIHAQHFPLCARCAGMFLGALLGLGYQAAQGRKGRMPSLWAGLFFGVLALTWVLDGVNSFTMPIPNFTSVYQTQNWTRLVTGTGMGLAISAVLWPTFIQTVFTGWEDRSALGNWKQIAGLVIAAAVLNVVILLEIPWILYLLALLGAGSVVLLLSTVYSLVLVMLFKRDNTFTRFSQFLLPLMGGYSVALIQIGVISLLRFYLTGTWSGFSL